EDPEYPTEFWALDDEGGVQDVDGEFRVYYEEPFDKIRWTFAPPVLWGEGQKLQRDWFFSFLHDPMPLRQQVRVKMPTFTYEDGEAESVADYFAAKAQRDYPAQYARNARLALGLDVPEGTEKRFPDVMHKTTGGDGLSLEAVSEGSRLSTDTLAFIENGAAAETAASFHKLHAWAESEGFVMHEPVKDSYEAIARRSASYMADREDFLPIGQRLGVQAVNCYQCHFHNGQAPEQAGSPIAWAPDLSLTRERLREDWVKDWLTNPSLIYPGTSMPANFQGDPPQYQDAYPDSTNDQQIQAVMDWLYNFDKIPEASN
ncbi:MAG: c-type cytochrome, partial [Planctomycetota bacterium]